MQTLEAKIERLMNNVIQSKEAVGANILILHKGQELYHKVFGLADKELQLPMKRDTIFRLFSMTKPVTACATMILVERGELDLQDPVSKYLEGFQNQTVWTEEGLVPVEREVTIFDLLNMTSGIPYPDLSFPTGVMMDQLFSKIKEQFQLGNPTSTLEYCNQIGKIPLSFQPGCRWQYGLSADILGGIIEVISKKSYGAFLKDEIFDPLHMKDTGFFVPKEKEDRFAVNYYFDEEKKDLLPFLEQFLGLEGYGEDVSFESGGAGLVSTIDDYKNFAQMLLQGGTYQGIRILGKHTVDFMIQSRVPESQREAYRWGSNLGYGYGCLMRILEDSGAAANLGSIGEFGWDGWTGNYVTIAPREELVILYFIQRAGAGTSPAVRTLRNIVYGEL